MNARNETMNLVMFHAPTGRMGAAWRSPTSRVEELWNVDLPASIVEQAEEAKFDAVFLADVLYFLMGGKIGAEPFPTGYEPITTMGALAARTKHIGLIGTLSTEFIHPYNMARYLSSLDWLSGGRVGWNMVTSQAGQEHYGIELPPSDQRYARAAEFLAATKALWDAWDDDAVVNDRNSAVWARADRIHPVAFEGEIYKTAGQLFMSRSPQGWPVLVQAGQSPAGMDYAARNAEVVFTAQTEVDLARDFYREVKERAVSVGRNPDGIRILPGITPIVAETTDAARAIEDDLDRYIDLDLLLHDLETALQTKLGDLDPDKPIPPERLVDPDKAAMDAFGGSRYRNIYDLAVRDKHSIRRLVGINDRSLGHSTATGSTQSVADQMQDWFESRACDGFAIAPVTVPEGLDSVCRLLMPELQRRGLARTEYSGRTLRENLGLPRPTPERRTGR